MKKPESVFLYRRISLKHYSYYGSIMFLVAEAIGHQSACSHDCHPFKVICFFHVFFPETLKRLNPRWRNLALYFFHLNLQLHKIANIVYNRPDLSVCYLWVKAVVLQIVCTFVSLLLILKISNSLCHYLLYLKSTVHAFYKAGKNTLSWIHF